MQKKTQENVRKILEGGDGGEKTKLVLDRYVKNRALIKSLAEHFKGDYPAKHHRHPDHGRHGP